MAGRARDTSARAAETAAGEQHARSVSGAAGSCQSRSVTPIACCPARCSATALSTPPLIATATRPVPRLGAEDRAERGRERLDGERLPAYCSRLEQREPVERALEAWCVRSDDRVAVDRQPSGRPRVAARRISEDLACHRVRLATGRETRTCSTLPITPAVANLASQVGAVRSVGNAYLRLRLPLRVCWFTFRPGPRTGSSAATLAQDRQPASAGFRSRRSLKRGRGRDYCSSAR